MVTASEKMIIEHIPTTTFIFHFFVCVLLLKGFMIERSLKIDIVTIPKPSPRTEITKKDTINACSSQCRPRTMLAPHKGNAITPDIRSEQEASINNFCTLPNVLVVLTNPKIKVQLAIMINAAKTKQNIPNPNSNVSFSKL